MQDRFKYRAWSKERNRYVTDKDIKDIFCNTYVKNHDLLELEDCSSYIVEQCTGLKDKNGKLIYEGDIVTGFFNNNKVIWDKGSFCVDDGSGVFDELAKSNEDCVIIGNIHENPELLEKNKHEI